MLAEQGDLFSKHCSRCKVLKPFDQFSTNGLGKWKSHCKSCGSKASRAYEVANAEAVAAKKAHRYRENIDEHKRKRAQRYWKDPESAKASARAWGAANKELAKKQATKWARENPEARGAIRSRNLVRNRDKYNESSRLRKLLYRRLKPDESRAKAASYRERNRARMTAYVAIRHARKMRATPPWVDQVAISKIYFAANFLGMVTGEWYHVDHIVPLQGPLAMDGPFKGERIVSGLHCEANLQVIPGRLNQSKSNRYWPDMP
ncbi:post-segregation antitoxin (ccd killing protein) [Paraburkholderia bannensis]|uniref:Post-segregation antitoxin (Ccd killing protein) n=1 Tax=Paraburkholderia bannensis TaxID=765414 RepID=A0A7W9TXK0_9BURK|nr:MULTISPECIES: hypothetical protein [Paraburkholderia]MBB3258248.1 hypothetical protein [Paraburkholderia sp. WP4_3_2]MBB6103261.1 post-segregation antitoxin (ccd killing protein) [Paraburkholderia bannensis]